MGIKAYFMDKMKKQLNEDVYHLGAVRELEAMPELEFVELAAPEPFLDEVSSTPGGESIRWCAQCGTCSASCPNVAQMDHSPRKMIALIRTGNRYDTLTSNTMWVCASCYLCTVRCPKEVKITELMHALERLSNRHGLSYGRATAAMYKAFIDSIKNNGRVYELGMMLKFYLSALLTAKMNPLSTIKMLPLALKLLSHGRMAIKPTRIKGSKQLKTIVEKAQTLGGAR
ncbi:MAG: 4Fe-4S dicluster domain-containing protein [Dehalococcoidales bacterium]